MMNDLFRDAPAPGLNENRRNRFVALVGPTMSDDRLVQELESARATGDFRRLRSYASNPSTLERIQSLIALVGGAYSPEGGASVNPRVNFFAGPARVDLGGNYNIGPGGRGYGLRGRASAQIGDGELSLSGNYDGGYGGRPKAGARLTYRRGW